MKQLIYFFSGICLCVSSASAQALFTTIDSVNINRINASVLVHGDMWWRATDTNYSAKCFFPNGTQHNLAFASALWLSGYDWGANAYCRTDIPAERQ